MIGDEIVFAIIDEINEHRDTGIPGCVSYGQIGPVKFRSGCAELDVEVRETDGSEEVVTISAAPVLTRMLGHLIWEAK